MKPVVEERNIAKLFSVQGKVVLITSNPEAAQDPRVAYSVLYRRTGTLHTHRMVYQLLTDLVAYRYRVYLKEHSES